MTVYDPLSEEIAALWSLSDALEFIRKLQLTIKPKDWHCGLTGSVLFYGYSLKDLDIIIYPHKSDGSLKNCGELLEHLQITLGLKVIEQRDHSNYQDQKLVYQTEYNNKRIDLFFLL